MDSSRSAFPTLSARVEQLEGENRWLRRMTFTALLLTAFTVVSVAVAQRPAESVMFNGQRFEPGMPKTEALARLAQCCSFSGNGDSSFITTKEPPIDIIGAIWFVGNKVSMLRQDLGAFQDDESVKLGLLLYRRLSEITQSGSRATLTMGTQEMSNGTSRIISLDLETGRSLVLETATIDPNEAGLQAAVSVYEELR
jgi:hypothetical protein